MTLTDRLDVKLGIDTSEIRGKLAQAAMMMRSFSAGAARIGGSGIYSGITALPGLIGNAFSVLSSGIAQVGDIGLKIGLGAGGILAYGISQITDLGGELSDMSARTGIAVDSLMAMREAFRESGIDVESVTTYVRKMNETILAGKPVLQALGLDAASLAKAKPDEAFESIIASIRKLGSVAEQQKALSAIFGNRQGTQLMTLVADPNSFSSARKMLGELPATMAKNANDFDRVSDNLFGGLGVKAQQFFSTFAEGLLPGLLAATDWIESLDLSPIGKQLSGQLTWSWGIFSELLKNGDAWEFVKLRLVQGFQYAVSWLVGGLKAAWNAVFNEQNMAAVGMIFKSFVTDISQMLHKDFADIWAKINPAYAAGPRYSQTATMPSMEVAKAAEADLRSTGYEAKAFQDKDGNAFLQASVTDYELDKLQVHADQKLARQQFNDGLGMATEAGAKSMQDFVTAIANIKPLEDFQESIAQSDAKIKELVDYAANTGGISKTSPIEQAGGLWAALQPAMTQVETKKDKIIAPNIWGDDKPMTAAQGDKLIEAWTDEGD